MNLRTRSILLAGLFAAAALGCAEETDVAPGFQVSALSTNQVVIGETMEVHVVDPEALHPDQRSVLQDAESITLQFEGQYFTDDGRVEDVAWGVGTIYDGLVEGDDVLLHALRLSRFGPFGNPFSESDRPGTFEGTVAFVAEMSDGLVVESTRKSKVALDVGPSIIIERFEPLEAGCGAPALRALAGLAYQMDVRAVGIKPVRFTYQIGRINDRQGTVEFTHDFGGPTDRDTLGVDEAIIFNPIPADQQAYTTGIRVIAEDAEGRTVETALPMSVHRPIEIMHSGKRELAERYTPVPVSGCTPGSIGSQVTYSETRTEYRQQSVSITIKQEWAQQNGTTRTQSWQEGISEGSSRSRSMGGTDREEERAQESYGVSYGTSEANSMNYSSTDGESWSWSRRESEGNTEYEDQLDRLYGSGSWSGTVGVEGSGSVPGFAKVTGKASTTVGVVAGGSVGNTMGQSRTRTSDRGFSMSGNSSETRGFGSTVTDSTSENVSGTYALSRARARSFQDSDARSESRTYDFSEAASQAEVVSQGMSESEQRTWVSSSADQTVQAFSGFIPRGKVGIFYRQTTRWVRRAEVRGYNQCGLAEHMGELQFNEWTWAPDLAIGNSCDSQPPPTNLEPATCFIEPCG